MIHPFVAVAVYVKLGPEGARVTLSLGTLIDQCSEFAAHRLAIGVGFDKILLDFRAY